TPLLIPVEGVTADSLPASQRSVASRAIASLAASAVTRGPVTLIGQDKLSKRSVAAAICGLLGIQLYELSAEMLPSHSGELETLARLWQREVRLSSLALFLDAQEIDKLATSFAGDSPAQKLARFVARTQGLVF